MTQSNIVKCRATAGTQLAESAWTEGQPTAFIYMPAGEHELQAGWRDGAIRIAVRVDEETPAALQASFDDLAASTAQEIFADEDHQSRKATLHFPKDSTVFSWGQLRGVQGVILSGGLPTRYGSEMIVGKTYRSWSPEFFTDADYGKLTRSERGLYQFPDFARGSTQNPAKVIGLGRCLGTLTNSPAFAAMPPVKATQADAMPPELQAVYARLSGERATGQAAVTSILDRAAKVNRVFNALAERQAR